MEDVFLFYGRGDKIRTCGPYVPNVVLYQTEPHLVQLLYYSTDFVVCKALFRFFCFLMQNVKSTLKRKVTAWKIPHSNPIAKKKKHSKHSIKHAEPHEMPGSHTQEQRSFAPRTAVSEPYRQQIPDLPEKLPVPYCCG